MKIAYVSTLRSTSWGGSEELWYQSAEEALRSNYEIGVFVYDWPDEPAQLTRLRQAGAFIHKRKRVPSLWDRAVLKVGGDSVSGMLNPYKPLEEFAPDLVIVTDGSTYYAADDVNLSGLLMRSFPNRYVIISQSNTDYHLPSDRQHTIGFFEGALKIFFVSEGNRRLANHQLAYTLTRTDVIQNPLLLDSLDGIPYPGYDGIIHCALVGRLSISDKGQDILLSVMNEPEWRNSNIRFHLYGKGQDKAYLEALTNYYGLGDRVIIEGFTENRTSIWKTCHCLLMCSHTEGTPLTLLEAMTAGRVCIVTRVGGNEEWITDGETGFLVEAPTRRLFSARLKEAVARFGEWPAIGAAAHQFAKENIQLNTGKILLDKITVPYGANSKEGIL